MLAHRQRSTGGRVRRALPALGILFLVGMLLPGERVNAVLIREVAFGLCPTGGGKNCVVDGDTIWVNGIKVRILDIDAPETHPPRCALEADLGARATRRLAQLLNSGPFQLVAGERDADRYGRKLRRIVRGGQSLGDQLVREGLARRYEGGRRPWC